MGWKYDPPTYRTEADNLMADYRTRLRAAEARDRLELNDDGEPSTGNDSGPRRSRNRVAALVMRLARFWKKTPAKEQSDSL